MSDISVAGLHKLWTRKWSRGESQIRVYGELGDPEHSQLCIHIIWIQFSTQHCFTKQPLVNCFKSHLHENQTAAPQSMKLEDLSHISFSPTWVGETGIWLLIYSTLPMPTEHEFSKYHLLHVGTESSKSCTDLAEYLLEPVIQSTRHLIMWNHLFTYLLH